MRIVCAVTSGAFGWRIPEHLGLVTGQAICIAMLAEQREACEVMIKEQVFMPRDIIVAVLAGLALAAAVRVVLCMAGTTCRHELGFENRFDVTGDALDVDMRAVQDVVGIDIVVKSKLGPGLGNVAGVASRPEMTIVIVVVVMTR